MRKKGKSRPERPRTTRPMNTSEMADEWEDALVRGAEKARQQVEAKQATDADLALVPLVRDGKAVGEIAERLGISTRTVRRRMERLGLCKRSPTFLDRVKNAGFRSLDEVFEGRRYSYRVLAEKLGVSISAIEYHYHRWLSVRVPGNS